MIFAIVPGVYGLVALFGLVVGLLGCCLGWLVWLYSDWLLVLGSMFGCWWVFLLLLLVVVCLLVIDAEGWLLIVLLTSLFYSFGVVCYLFG